MTSYRADKYTAPAGAKRAVAKTFDLWSSTTMPNVSISGEGCAYCSVYNDISLYNPHGWGVSVGECVSIMALENVSINDGRPYSALEMIAQLRAYSINSCGEVEKIGPQEEKYWDLNCAPCSIYEEIYDDTHQVSIGDARCVKYDQVVDVSIGMDYDCPSALKLIYKLRAVELNACGEIESVSPTTEHEKTVDLEDKSFHSGSVTVVTNSKTELTNDGGVSSSLTCSTDEQASHSHGFTLDVTTTTYTLTSYQRTKTFVFECGRLLSVSAESGWSSTNSETWTTQTIGCSGGDPPSGECPCDPGVQTIYLDLVEPDTMDPLNNPPTYTQIELNWTGYPSCTYVSADGSVSLTFDVNANGMNGAWILTLTPSGTAGIWNEDIGCSYLFGGVFYDSDDPNGITEATVSQTP
jgi:hypothetical protein